MKTSRSWWVIGIILVLVAGAIAYAVINKDDMPSYSQDTYSEKTSQENTQNPVADPGSPATAQPGKYVNYNTDNFASASESRRWLFFHAGWCPQCRALEKDIQESGVPDGIVILKVDYDSEDNLKEKYGVTLQTTVVEVDSQGNEIAKFVAYDDPTLDAVVKALGD